MAGLIGVDCVASFSLRSVTFPCELDYLHEGPHRVTLRGEEHRIFKYGHFLRRDAETVLTWDAADLSYGFNDPAGNMVPRDEEGIREKHERRSTR